MTSPGRARTVLAFTALTTLAVVSSVRAEQPGRFTAEAVDDAFPTRPLRKMAGAVGGVFGPDLMASFAESLVAREERRFGIVTLVTPQSRGEIVRVVVPIGELTARLARRISEARRRRAETRARETVERDLREFLARQPPK